MRQNALIVIKMYWKAIAWKHWLDLDTTPLNVTFRRRSMELSAQFCHFSRLDPLKKFSPSGQATTEAILSVMFYTTPSGSRNLLSLFCFVFKRETRLENFEKHWKVIGLNLRSRLPVCATHLDLFCFEYCFIH